MIFTLGHSTLSQNEFIKATHGVEIIDVRSHPGSRHVPHFNLEAMEVWLPEAGLQYHWWPELGGWDGRHAENIELNEFMASRGVDLNVYGRGAFPKQRIGRDRPETGDGPSWTNQGLYDYAWYTALSEFQGGVSRLVQLYNRHDRHCAIVCCEALWWKCHRSMIADCLTYRQVFCGHLPCKPPKRAGKTYTPHDRHIGNRLERYPTAVMDAWSAWSGPSALVSAP